MKISNKFPKITI